uniref:RRM domain-containing protein n=1 Tax=Zea mays TaxID=4577 RepID=A0A804MGG6_MAIZE
MPAATRSQRRESTVIRHASVSADLACSAPAGDSLYLAPSFGTTVQCRDRRPTSPRAPPLSPSPRPFPSPSLTRPPTTTPSTPSHPYALPYFVTLADCLIKAFRGHIVLPLPDKNTVESQVGGEGVGWRAEDEGDHVGQPRRRHEQANHGDNMGMWTQVMLKTLGNNLYVTVLSPCVTDQGLKKHFSTEGEVIDASIVYDPWTREPRGFGFVTMAATKEADHCIKYLDCSVLQEHFIVLSSPPRIRDRLP